MPKLSPAELERKKVIDTVRAMVSLKLKIRKREILNDIEDEILTEFDSRLAAGKAFRLDVRSVIEEVGHSLEA